MQARRGHGACKTRRTMRQKIAKKADRGGQLAAQKPANLMIYNLIFLAVFKADGRQFAMILSSEGYKHVNIIKRDTNQVYLLNLTALNQTKQINYFINPFLREFPSLLEKLLLQTFIIGMKKIIKFISEQLKLEVQVSN